MTKKDIELIYCLNKNWQPDNIGVKRAGGQTNRNYVAQYKNKKFFVRLSWERSDIVDRRTEGRNIFAFVRNRKVRKILPKYYLYIYQGKNILKPKSKEVFNLPEGTMVTKYIEKESLKENY